MKKIGIIGPGAMGCLFAASVKKAGFEATLIDKSQERCAYINEHGVFVEGVSGSFQVKVPCITPSDEAGEFDLIMVCVKAHATEKAVEMHRSRIGSETVLLTLQNGYGNVDSIKRHVPAEQIMAGITSQGANAIGTGKINHAGHGDSFIGELSGEVTDRINRVREVLDKSGFPTAVSGNVEELIFTKLLINVGINALTGILKVRNGCLNEFGETRELMKQAVAEGLQVAAAINIELDGAKIQNTVEEVADRTSKNRSSMLMDILNERKTEIDFINGAIVKLGRRCGVAAPVNEVFLNLVQAIERTYDITEAL